MRVLAAGICANAGAAPPIPEIAPRPSAAAPPARNLRRAGLDGRRGGSQHWHVAKNLRRIGLAFIPSSRFVVMCAGLILWERIGTLAFGARPFQAGRGSVPLVRIWRRLGAAPTPRSRVPLLPPKAQPLTIRCAKFA